MMGQISRWLRGSPSGTVTDFTPTFAVGTGRCGTHFLHAVLERDPTLASFHCDTRGAMLADSFMVYAQWNGLNVDHAGFVAQRRRWIAEARAEGRIYVESNPYLPLLSGILYRATQARFVFLIRRPEDVVNSEYVKGWYREAVIRSDPSLAVGIQPEMAPHHLFFRIMPSGEDYERWRALTRIGRIAWWWNTVNLRCWEELRKLPEKALRRIKIEEFDYASYCDIHLFIGGATPLKHKEFDKIRARRPGRAPQHRTRADWSADEEREFLAETRTARELFGY